MIEPKNNSGKPQQNFQIGQIVYLLSEKAEAIVPAIVVEELILKKLDGNTISWKMAVGPPEKKKVLASTDLEGEIYTSLEEIRRVMLERLTGFVTNLISQAEKRTEAWYGKQMVNHPTIEGGGKIDPASLIDSIDGASHKQQSQQKANTVSQFTSVTAVQPESHSSLRDRLRDMATPEDYEDMPGGETGEFVILPDGRKVPVKVNIQQ